MSSDIFTDDSFNEDTEFKAAVKWSLIAHVVILAVFTIKAAFFKPEAIDYSSAVRVDIVGLPDKLDPNKVSLEKPEEKTEAQKKKDVLPEKLAKTEPDAINLNKTKDKQKEAFEKLKKQNAIDKIKEEMEKEKSAKESLKKVTQVKGNILSPGTALTGLNKLQHDNYVAELDKHIKERWILPEWMANRDFKAQVRVRIDEKGQVISREIIKSSGNPDYDDKVMETIDASAPFAKPPEKFAAILSVQGIVIGFPE